jgi:hypothetical protein
MGRVTREITESKDFGWDPARWVVLDLDVVELMFAMLKVPVVVRDSRLLILNP